MASEKIWQPWEDLLSGQDLEPLEVLKAAAMYERYFQEVQSHAARVARAEGRSWQDIAEAVSVSRQTARQKWHGSPQSVRERSITFGEFAVKPPVQAAEVFDSMVLRMVESLTAEDDPIRDELLRAGRDALAEAIEAHRDSPGTVPFTVFASWWIRQALNRRFAELRP